MSLNLTSVFTHQSPQVEWPPASPTNQCELADLLLAVIDRRSKSSTRGSGVAVLLQVKLSDTYSVKLTGGDQTQFDLLAKRPVFDVKSKATAPKGIDLKRHKPDQGLQYLLTPPDQITPPPQTGHLWRTKDQLSRIRPAYTVSASTCLAELLVDLLQSNTGSSFTLSQSLPPGWIQFAAPNRDDWSMLINHLLEHTFGKPLVQLSGRPPRGRDHALYMVSNQPGKPSSFFLFDGDPDSPMASRVFSERVPQGMVRLSQAGDGGSGRGRIPRGEENGFSDGAISTVLFEIGDLNNE